MYGVPVIERSLGIEVNIKTANIGDQFFFPDNQIIRASRIRVYGIEAFTVTQLAKTPGALTTISAAGSLGLVLNFVDSGNANRVYQIPYYTFISSLNAGMIREFKPFECMLTKSFIQLTDSTVVAGTGAYLHIIYKQI
jgi:hypothetical protein